ncbi:Tn3 family transposase [Streptomyces sp. NPDC060085]|uniref:Tn3 family transposase n=1 Tax=Streptomyces sp. NPDC060085 TaxID=3347054 RepID=UPI003664E52A
MSFTPVIKPDVPALSRDRLVQVDQGYVRAENISVANGLFVEAQAKIDVVTAWGGDLVASADGVRFTVQLGDCRTCLGVAPQPHLTGDPVHDAIAYGRPGASEEKVETASRRRSSRAALSAPRRLPAPVGEDGRTLAAGQRQLIALARAQPISPDVLLNEPPSAVDPVTEAAVSDALARLTEGRTPGLCCYRLVTAARADHVVVLAAGVTAARARIPTSSPATASTPPVAGAPTAVACCSYPARRSLLVTSAERRLEQAVT